MRKVSKCALLLVAIICFICFLFYKTRYDKLYNVLEVLEFFGNDQSFSNRGGNSIGVKNNGAIWQPPAWQKVTEDVHVFSAFCGKLPGSNDLCPVVTVLAIAPKKSESLLDLSCQLWYEGSIQPVSVPVTSMSTAKNENNKKGGYRPHLFTCESKFASLLPFGVTLHPTGNSQFKPYVHVLSPASLSLELPANMNENEFLLCLRPQKVPVDSTYQALENVLLHSHFGIRHFFVYDSGLTNKFVNLLTAINLNVSLVNVKVLPWNIPVHMDRPEDVDYLVQKDCQLRSRLSGFKSWAVMSLEQILVPKSGSKTVMDALEQSRKTGNLIVQVLKFCSEYLSDDDKNDAFRRQLVSLQQTMYNSKLSSGQSTFIGHKKEGGEEKGRLSKDELAVHDYGPCDNYDLDPKAPESIRDRTIFRQASVIEREIGKYFPLKQRH